MEADVQKTTLFFISLLMLSSCGPAAQVSGAISTCRLTVDAISALTGGLEIPANFRTSDPVKKGGEFDVMQYFSVLDHLSLVQGYMLDYVYHFDGMGGSPILYVRPATQPPYAAESDLAAAGDTPRYLDYVQTDETPESYFQLAVLSLMGNQFYLYWHADYNDSQIICTKVDVTDIVTSLDGNFGYPISLISRVRAALLSDVGPVVNLGTQEAEVRLMTFTRWGGFYQQIFTISRSTPHSILDVQQKNLVPYDCGVMF
jgi:hypothetical protein